MTESSGRVIRAIVFDLDGVLVDSEETWSRVRGGFVAEWGGQWTDSDQHRVMGDNSLQWAAYIKERWNVPLLAEQIVSEITTRMIAAYHQSLVVMPGAREAVVRLRGSYPLAVASSSPRAVIEEVLRIIDLRASFTAVVSSDDVQAGKPKPDVYLRAAALLTMPPTTCAAVEDSSNGLRAAHAAGMAVIAIPHRAFPPAADALALASRVLTSAQELDAGLIRAL